MDSAAFAKAFTVIQNLIKQRKVLAGHDVASGGLITTLLEMCFPSQNIGMELDFSKVGHDMVKVLFSENAGIVLQVADDSVEKELLKTGVPFFKIGNAIDEAVLDINEFIIDVDDMRDVWYETSHLLDQKQSFNGKADERALNYVNQPLEFKFPAHFTGNLP